MEWHNGFSEILRMKSFDQTCSFKDEHSGPSYVDRIKYVLYMDWNCGLVVGHLPSTCETPSSILSINK